VAKTKEGKLAAIIIVLVLIATTPAVVCFIGAPLFDSIQRGRRLRQANENLRQAGEKIHQLNEDFRRTSLGQKALTSAPSAAPQSAIGPAKLPFDSYSGYFVSNQFEPDAAESFVVLSDEKQFDRVFGVAMVMGDKFHRLPPDIFKEKVVLAAIKRGKAVWEFKVEDVAADHGVVQLRYTATAKASASATFACPLMVSIPRAKYAAVQFCENGKTVKTVELEGK
jgi:hypothetical protein